MQRRIEQADDDGQAVHLLEHRVEVADLSLIELVEGVLLGVLVLGEDEGLDELFAVAQEHVLGTVEADAGGAEVAGQLGVRGVVGVGADQELAAEGLVVGDLVGPLEDGLQVAGELRTDQLDLAEDDVAGGAVDGDDVTLVQHDVGAGDGGLLLHSVDV